MSRLALNRFKSRRRALDSPHKRLMVSTPDPIDLCGHHGLVRQDTAVGEKFPFSWPVGALNKALRPIIAPVIV